MPRRPAPSQKQPTEGPASIEVEMENRWWVDGGTKKDGKAKGKPRDSQADDAAEPIVGDLFFAVGRDFDQDRAQKLLTDSNLNLLQEANPEPGNWAYLNLIEDTSSPQRITKVKRMLRLPKWAVGVLVDAGTSIRAIASSDPIGDRVVELLLGKQSSFDAWSEGEWIYEKVFRSRERALREGSRLIMRYLKDPNRRR